MEAARALLRPGAAGQVPEAGLAEAARDIDVLWSRCDVWELTPAVCELAGRVAPTNPLRTLDALHPATYLLARRRLGELELLTADRRLAQAVGEA